VTGRCLVLKASFMGNQRRWYIRHFFTHCVRRQNKPNKDGSC
jgi:hypothetical protein